MSGVKEMKLEQVSIKPYQIDIILDNSCNLFFPATFASRDEHIRMLFLSDGYRPLKNEIGINASECMDIMYDAFYKMAEAMKRYIFPGEYIVDEDTIFVDDQLKDVKLIFKPSLLSKCGGNSLMEYQHMASETAICENMETICDILSRQCTDKARLYIGKVLENIKNDSYGIENIIHNLRLMKKEIYRLGVDSHTDIRETVRGNC